MGGDDLRFTTHLMPGGADADEALGDLTAVVARNVAVVFPKGVLPSLIEMFEADKAIQVQLNQNVAAVRTEFDALKSLDELGLLPRTDPNSRARHIDSAALLAQRTSTVQKAYENMFRSSLNLIAISEVFRKRTGEALPIPIEDWIG